MEASGSVGVDGLFPEEYCAAFNQSPLLTSMERLRHGPGTPCWAPDGGQVAFYWAGGDRLEAWVWEVSSGNLVRVLPDGFPECTAGERTVMDRYACDSPRWSPDGKTLAVAAGGGGKSNLFLVTGGTPVALPGAPGARRHPAWAPDGRWLAYVAYTDGRDDIWLFDPTDGHSYQVTYDGFDNSHPVWSPDGRYLAYVSQRSQVDPLACQICVLYLSDGRSVEVTERGRIHSRLPVWSPDGKRLYFLSDRSGYDEIWSADLDTGALRPVTGPSREDKVEFTLSPDGQVIAYTRSAGVDIHLDLLHLDSGKVRCLVEGPGVRHWPAWSPDGERLVFWEAGPYTPPELIVVDREGTRLTTTHVSPPVPRPLGRVEAVCIPGDGWPVDAVAYLPARSNGAGILCVHGGPNAQHANGWYPFLHYLTTRGYTILAPNCRGSTGKGRAFMDSNLLDWAGGDARDWWAGARWLRERLRCSRLGVWGRSYGGYATLMALALGGETFSAGVCQFGPTDLIDFFTETSVRHLMRRFLGLPFWNRALYRERSPLTHIDRIWQPLLVLQGESDAGVPKEQSERLVKALQDRGRPVRYRSYPGEGHGFDRPHHIRDAAMAITSFWEETIGAEG